MSRFMYSVLTGVAASFIATAAFAAASSVPADFTPDPALKTASISELTKRVRKACTVTQAQLQGEAEKSFQKPCGCYASQALQWFSPEELQEYRDTGVFNRTARDKALQALDVCELKRPF